MQELVKPVMASLYLCTFPMPVTQQTICLTATFYAPGLGACGKTNTEADMIVAIAAGSWDSYP